MVCCTYQALADSLWPHRPSKCMLKCIRKAESKPVKQTLGLLQLWTYFRRNIPAVSKCLLMGTLFVKPAHKSSVVGHSTNIDRRSLWRRKYNSRTTTKGFTPECHSHALESALYGFPQWLVSAVSMFVRFWYFFFLIIYLFISDCLYMLS